MSGTGSTVTGAPERGGESFAHESWRHCRDNRVARVCMLALAVFFGVALWMKGMEVCYLAQDVPPPWQVQDLEARYQPPGPGHWLGTDGLGRSVGYRLAYGATVAFQVGLVTSLIAVPLGVLLGCLGGYFGGKVDDAVVWMCNTFAAIPGLLFVLAIAMVVGKGLLGVYLGIGLTSWVSTCRLIRAEVLKQKPRGYVRAARTLGFSHARILFHHILPNVFHVAIVSFTLRFPSAIGTEVFLSFLGIGAQGVPTWGIMMSDARLRLWEGVWWEMASVTVAVFVVVLAFNLFGDALRDAMDPKLRKIQ